MGMDLDYLVAKQAIEELEEIVSDTPHGQRESIAKDISKFVEEMKIKHKQE